jgi:hypothetical protein
MGCCLLQVLSKRRSRQWCCGISSQSSDPLNALIELYGALLTTKLHKTKAKEKSRIFFKNCIVIFYYQEPVCGVTIAFVIPLT